MSDFLAIGCFGSVICNSSRNEVCKTCSLFSECRNKVKESLKIIREKGETDVSMWGRRVFQDDVELGSVDLSQSITSTKREKLTDYQRSIVENEKFPVKARELVASIFRKGITGKYIRNILQTGKNPFTDAKPKMLTTACRLILAGNLNVSELRSAFIHEGQSDKTALSVANSVIHAFLLLGVIDKNFKLRGESE